jgi:hypothetical protein
MKEVRMLQRLIERVWRPIERNWRGGVALLRAMPAFVREKWRHLRTWWRAKKRRSWWLREILLSMKWAAVITVSMLLRRWFEQWVSKGWLVESIMAGEFNHVLDVLQKGEARI